ncbi:MAG TPA: polysaccharide biosynthesis/export family protein [Caulobacteraceae bacterium]|jgi:polysaccharide export outer membrane protein|nr:polysaccharide biosynthesis/export family protein [Caulobacteraceae bacterium]
MSASRAACAALALALLAGSSAAAHPPAPFPNIPYATWSNDEPQYRLYPGDDVDVTIPSAPELNKTVTVQPDGRISLPLIAPQMAAGRSAEDVERELSAAYASQLLRPEVSVSVKAQPLKVFVGGEVGKPGVYDMPGDIDALRAIIEAGGFTDAGKRSKVIIIRRSHDGSPMMRTVDLDRAFRPGTGADLVPLRRFDIIYVPKTGLADLASFMTQLKNALPIQFTYAFGGIQAF